MRLIDPMIAELEQEAESTRRVLERIPEDRLSWRPHPKSMSLGQLALHIATTPGGVARVAGQDGMERPQFDRPEPKSKREVLEALEESVAGALEFLRGAGRCPGDRELDHDPRGQAALLDAAHRSGPDRHAQSLVSPPGRDAGVSPSAGRARAIGVRTDRGREPVRSNVT